MPMIANKNEDAYSTLMKFDRETDRALTVEEAEQLPLPLDLFEPNRALRSEYNIGKYAGIIFTSPYAKDVKETRKHSWEVTNGEEKVNASLTVTPLSGQKTPTTTTLRVYLALLEIWNMVGRPESGEIQFSARQLCQVIGWKWSGKDSANRISEHLSILAGTKLNWALAYKNKNKETEKMRSGMHILQSDDYRERAQLFKEEKFTAVQRVRFNSDLIENILAGHVRPVNHDEIRKIANDTIANLYMRLDAYLYKKPKWERRSLELLTEELGLIGDRYQKRFIRHAKLKEFVEALNGAKMMTGTLKLSIAETADGKDWKLVARKIMPKKALNKPPRVKKINSTEDATFMMEDIVATLAKHPRAGKPNRGFILFLCEVYPRTLMDNALALAKADFKDSAISLTAVFISEVRRLVIEHPKYEWYKEYEGTK